ncbi:hypothetical protein CLOM_g10853 [Closterium sp. NIES-68]|nr:hypothetical protein CLOM_g10853 [Closterium sp. NIES-68]GJP74810.1 hypothetical protein CLOP_g5344 [Closterium sp. NIES-67]
MPASLETNRASVADDNHPSAPSAPSAQSAPSAHHDSTQLRFNSVEEVPPLLLDLFRGWRMDDRQVLLLMRGRPGLARIDVAEKVLPGVRLLLACGVQPRDLAQSARYDSVWLGQPVEKIKEVVTFLRGLGLKDGESLGTVLRRFPRAFSCNAAIQLQPRVQKLLDLGIDDISYIIKACPRLLLISAERVQERLDFLAQVAGEGHVTSIVRRQPYILTQPITELQSKLDVFRDILGSEEDALKVFRQIRRLPAHSASKMTSTFHTLCEIVGPENAQKVVGKRSSILSTNSTTMRSNFEHWRALLSHLPPPKLANLFVRYPALLHLSWKSNIEPKAEFFERELGLSLAAVAAVPLVACYSLEQRIRPRVQRLQEAGIGIVETDKGIVCLPRGMVDGGRWRNADGGDSSSGSWEENDRGRNEGDNAQVQMGKADLGGDIGSRTDHGHLVVSEGYEEGLKFEGQQGENVKPGQVQQRAVSLSTLIQASKDRFDELLKKLVNGVDDWDKA